MSGGLFRRLFHAAVTGQVLTALGVVLMLRANIGLEPWSVFQQGLVDRLGISFGMTSILISLAAVIIALTLGERIGLGTVFSVVVPGVVIDWLLALEWIPLQETLWGGLLCLLAGLETLTLGTYFYMKPGLGSGPRDAMCVAVARRTGKTVGLCRSCIEACAIAVGWLLGGPVGVGTVVAMVGIGVLIDLNFRLLRFDPRTVRQETLAETLGLRPARH